MLFNDETLVDDVLGKFARLLGAGLFVAVDSFKKFCFLVSTSGYA